MNRLSHHQRISLQLLSGVVLGVGIVVACALGAGPGNANAGATPAKGCYGPTGWLGPTGSGPTGYYTGGDWAEGGSYHGVYHPPYSGGYGPTDSSGPTGNYGPSGCSGPTGSSGPSGCQGPSGSSGPTGSAGPSGCAGATGPTGGTTPATCGPDDGTHHYGGAGVTGEFGTTGKIGPTGQAGPFGQICVRFNRSGATLDSVDVTLTGVGNGSIQLYVRHGGSVVYQAQYSGSDLSPPGTPGDDSPDNWVPHTWSGTLSPSEWDGGCQSGSYSIDLAFIRRLYTQDLSSPEFTCRSN